MLHIFQPNSFADAARQSLFEAVADTLRRGLPADAPALLVGPLTLPGGLVADAVLVRPHSLTLLLLQPAAGGELRLTSFAAEPWQLDGQPVPMPPGVLNPYQEFAQLQPAAWQLLAPLLAPEAVNPRFITGLWITERPLRFGPGVEASMEAAPEARQLQLLPALDRLPRRLAQLATPEIELSAADIRQLGADLAAAIGSAPAAEPEEPVTLGSVVQNTARQLWRWLGAEDVADLPPDTYELTTRSEDRKHELEAQQAALQQQLTAKMQAMEAREAAREQSVAQLRTELARAQQQAAPHAAELQARLQAESRAQADEAARLQADQAEWQRRNADLDAKIKTLDQLIQQLHTAATAPPTVPPAPAPTPPVAPPPPPVAPADGPVAPPAAFAPAAPATLLAPLPIPPAAAATPAPGPDLRQRAAALWTSGRQRLQAHLPAADHWVWLALLGGLGLVLMIGLSTVVFRSRPPEPFQEAGRWGFAHKGEAVIPAKYASVQPFRDERAVVERDGAFGAVDADGQEVVAPAYDAMNDFAAGYARVRIGDLYTFVDAEGKEFAHYFYNAYDFAEGYAPVLDRRGWFYISGPDGVPVQPRIFQEAYPFHDGLARVRTGGTYTFITPDYLRDTTRGLAPFGRYEQATDFADGRAQVQQNGRHFIIDQEGREVAD